MTALNFLDQAHFMDYNSAVQIEPGVERSRECDPMDQANIITSGTSMTGIVDSSCMGKAWQMAPQIVQNVH